MRAYQVFAGMKPEHAEGLFRTLSKESPDMFTNAVAAASTAMKSRPTYLLKQPFEKRVQAVRRALSRVSANGVAEEILAVYFLDCRKPLLTEWLDALGLEHEDGALKEEEPAEPDEAKLQEAVKSFRGVDEDPDRELLIQAFAAQSAIEWPALEKLIAE